MKDKTKVPLGLYNINIRTWIPNTRLTVSVVDQCLYNNKKYYINTNTKRINHAQF